MTPDAEHKSPAHGLNEAETRALREVLDQLSPHVGRDLGAIFDHLENGGTMLSALGLPEGAVDVIYAQAYARFNAGDIDRARTLFEALVTLAPDRQDHWLGLGICARRKDEHGAAQIAFDTALALNPESPAAQFHRCELACLTADWPTARKMAKGFVAAPDSAVRTGLAGEMNRLLALIEARTGKPVK